MSTLTKTNRVIHTIESTKVLAISIKVWIGIALIGQWLFALYILMLYALPMVFNSTQLTYDLIPGKGVDWGNQIDSVMFFSHIIPAALIAISGLLQLIPNIRLNHPQFHKYNGRMFFILGVSGALTGMYLSFVNSADLFDLSAMGIRINGVLIPVFIYFAWRFAVKKDFKSHQRFAIHSFLLVNGVWTFRLYLFGWYLMNQGSNGNNNDLNGPMDIAISFACYLLPMAIAEVYFWAQHQRSKGAQWVTSLFVSLGAFLTLIGMIAACLFIWVPTITNVVKGLV